MTHNGQATAKLLTEEAEKFAGERYSSDPMNCYRAIAALLADRQARIEREKKVRDLLATAKENMNEASPEELGAANQCILEALSLLK